MRHLATRQTGRFDFVLSRDNDARRMTMVSLMAASNLVTCTLKLIAMPNPIESLLATGTKLWLDSIDPDLVRSNRAAGATGADINPIIVADLVATGRFDADIDRRVNQGLDDSQIAWQADRQLVRQAQEVFCRSGRAPAETTVRRASSWTRCWRTRRRTYRTDSGSSE